MHSLRISVNPIGSIHVLTICMLFALLIPFNLLHSYGSDVVILDLQKSNQLLSGEY